MSEGTMDTGQHDSQLRELRPVIKVIGVGGAGGNAINNMIASGLEGVDYVVANTDAQALQMSAAPRRIQLGVKLTEGLGAGSRPEIGLAAAEEAIEEIRREIADAHMVFIAAGMGGGTGTGAASVIARTAREMDVLTVGIVTRPFLFEGSRRARIAEAGIHELRGVVDTLIVIPNQNLFHIANERTTFAEAFQLADRVLHAGIACIVDLIMKDGLINLDFADVRIVMQGMGTAVMGTGEASGAQRALKAAEQALANPLIDDLSLVGAKGLLVSIIGGRDMTLFEVDEAASRVRQEVDPDANIIVGASFDETLGDRIRVAIVAAGMNSPVHAEKPRPAASIPAAGIPKEPPSAPPAPLFNAEALRPTSMQGHAASSTPPPVPASREHREVWQAPHGVTIEAAVPPTRSGPAQPSAALSGQGGAARRMPTVDEFPPIAQRELAARSSPAGTSREHARGMPPPPLQTPSGLLQRLVGGALGRAPADNGQHANQKSAIHTPRSHGAPASAEEHLPPPLRTTKYQ